MTDILRLKVEAALLEGLADETVSYLDQFIYRFTKLQDAMGTRLFPALACMITGSDEPRPFLDILTGVPNLYGVKHGKG